MPTFPLMEFISSCHNADFLSFTLDLFVEATKYFLNEGDVKPVIDKIEIDRTLALMQAISRSFINMSLLQYLKVVSSNINKDTGKIKSDLNMTIIHTCSSHLINTWWYLLYSGENINFDEKDMENIRAWIFSTLLDPNCSLLHIY